VANSSLQSGRNIAKRSPATRAAERARPRLAAQHLGDLADHLVADVHAEVVVDDVQAIDVEVEHAVRAFVGRAGQRGPDLHLERGARQQRGRRVEVVLQDAGHLARQQLGEPLGAQVEIGLLRGAEQREEARDPARGVAHRHREDLVGGQAGGGVDLVDDQAAPLQRGPVHQVAVRGGEDGQLRLAAGGRLADRDVALRHHQRAEHAVEMLHAGLHDHAELVRLLGILRIVRRDLEQQVEVLVPRLQVADHHAEAGARDQLALQALEGGMHEVVHERVGTALAVPRQQHGHGDHQATVVAQPERVGGRPLEVEREPVDLCRRGRRDAGERLLDDGRRIGAVIAVGNPQRVAARIVESDPAGPRHEHAQQLAVGVEARPGRGQMQGQYGVHR
jgi:hypothetical protein